VSAHGVAGPRSVLSGPATRGGGQPDAPTPTPGTPDVGPGKEAQPAPQRPDHLRVVEPRELSPTQRRRRARFAAGVAGLFVMAALFGVVGLHIMLAQNQFRLDRLNTQAAAEQARYERLRLQVDQLESPQRIVDTAEQKLGMLLPSSVTYLTPPAPLPTAAKTPSSADPAGKGTSPSTTLPAAGAPPDWATVKPHLAANP
jgi:cell division protein FtsL